MNSLSNPLGSFQYHYNAATGRLGEVDLPNGAKTLLGYFDGGTDPQGGGRLRGIQHLLGGNNLEKERYTYDPAGQIQAWRARTGPWRRPSCKVSATTWRDS